MTENHITITYCAKCRWLLRASWMAQEILSTFEEEVNALTLKPGSSGQFDVEANGQTIWSRATDGGFPDIKELKQRVRNVIAPERDLGHLESPNEKPTS